MWAEAVSKEFAQEVMGDQEGGMITAGEREAGPVDIAETHSPGNSETTDVYPSPFWRPEV